MSKKPGTKQKSADVDTNFTKCLNGKKVHVDGIVDRYVMPKYASFRKAAI